MARVHVPPHYVNADRRAALDVGAGDISALVDAIAGGADAWLFEGEYDERVIEAVKHVMTTKGRAREESWVKMSRLIRSITRADDGRAYADYDAMIRMWSELTSDTACVSPDETKLPIAVEDIAREIAMIGMIGSFATPRLASRRAKSIPLMRRLKEHNAAAANCVVAADALRKRVTSSETMEAFKSGMEMGGFEDAADFEVHNHPFPLWRVYHIGPYTAVYSEATGNGYVLSANTRRHLADVTYTAGMWVLAGLSSSSDGALCAADTGFAYCRDAVASALMTGADTRRIARQMKVSYACMLAGFRLDEERGDEREIAAWQVEQLRAEAVRECMGEALWVDTMTGAADRTWVDFGTAWHMLPPPDCDMQATNEAMKGKFNASRAHNSHAWTDLCNYTRMAITAHYIASNPDATIRWNTGDDSPESFDWVMRCRGKAGKGAATLTYCPNSKFKDECAWGVAIFKWTRHLETWHHSADDVTHVYADIDRYGTRDDFQASTTGGMSELIYCMERGHLLSGTIPPAAVRKAWGSGYFPGDRVAYSSVKAENTKYPGKQRETLSADDITREILTEVDINMSKVGRVVHGVAMRAGRPGTEAKVESVVNTRSTETLLVSLDVSGWSPNMDRKGELMFADAILDMFDIPAGMRISSLLRGLLIVTSKMGFHDVWEARDGSVQGWLGTTDTILHTMVAQRAVSLMRDGEQHLLGANGRISKVALIDDIVACISGVKVPPRAVLEGFKAYYASLRLEADMVKTLCRKDLCQFLNRNYYRGEELLTSAKIFAKADREWDRRFVTVGDEIDAIMGSFGGAADRGFAAPEAYTTAIWRAIWRVCITSPAVATDGALLSLVFAWLPRALGGLGIPDTASWLARETVVSFDAAMSCIFTIRAQLHAARHPLATTVDSYLFKLSGVALDAVGAVRFCEDPMSVRAKGLVDPAAIPRQLARKVLMGNWVCSEFKTLAALDTDGAYEAIFRRVLEAGAFPADVLTEFAAAMPHATAGAVVEKMLVNDVVLRRAGARRVNDAWVKFMRSNKGAVRAWRFLRFRQDDQIATLTGATEYVAHLRARACAASGFTASGMTAPAASDIVRMSASAADVKIYVKAPSAKGGDMGTTPEDSRPSLMRSQAPKSAAVMETLGVRDRGPASRAVKKITNVASLAAACGESAAVLVGAWKLAWGADDAIVPAYHVSAENTRRVCSRFKLTTHTVAAYPNYAQHVRVDASRAMRALEPVSRAFSWLSVVYFLKAASALDVDLAGGRGFTREFTIRPGAIVPNRTGAWPDSWEAPEYSGGTRTIGRAAILEALNAMDAADADTGAVIAPTMPDVLMEIEARMRAAGKRSVLDMEFAGAGQAPDVVVSRADIVYSKRTRPHDANEPATASVARWVKAVAKVWNSSGPADACAFAADCAGNMGVDIRDIVDADLRKSVSACVTRRYNLFRGIFPHLVGTFLLDVPAGNATSHRMNVHLGYANVHTVRSENLSAPKNSRYRSKFLAGVYGLWGQTRITSYAHAMELCIQAAFRAMTRITERTGGARAGWQLDVDHLHDEARRSGADLAGMFVSIASACVGPNFEDYADLIDGAARAGRTAQMYAYADFAREEIKAYVRRSQIELAAGYSEAAAAVAQSADEEPAAPATHDGATIQDDPGDFDFLAAAMEGAGIDGDGVREGGASTISDEQIEEYARVMECARSVAEIRQDAGLMADVADYLARALDDGEGMADVA